jgi:hypothetical protein
MIVELLKGLFDMVINLFYVVIVKPLVAIFCIPLDAGKVLVHWTKYFIKVIRKQ